MERQCVSRAERRIRREEMKSLKCLAAFSACLFLLPGALQTLEARDGNDDMACIMRLLGADDPEELDSETVERLTFFLRHPLPVNSASRSRLASSGIFTQYQLASLIDSRSRSGDILSFSELAALDGFGQETAAAVAPFISLVSASSPGRSSASSGNVRNSLILRSSGKFSGGEDDFAYGLKYRLSADNGIEFGIAANRGYSSGGPLPGTGTFHLAYYGRKNTGKIVIGDYNLRYGQGLALWSGFSMSGTSYPQSFFRRASGISPYLSFSGDGGYRGAAADFSFGRFTVSASVGAGGLKEAMAGKKNVRWSVLPAVNVSWLGRSAQASVTLAGETSPFGGMPAAAFRSSVASADFRCNVRGVDIFGEAALDIAGMRPSAVAGTAFRAGENTELAFSGKYSPDGYSVASGGKFSAGERIRLAGKDGFGSDVMRHSGVFCAEAIYFPFPRYGSPSDDWQMKIQADYKLRASPSVGINIRFTERLRSAGEKNRTELRCDAVWSDGVWTVSMRTDAVRCESTGLLSYVEGGCTEKRFSAYLRAGVFRADSWKDRIYAYERDAPGNFNVPAYYGRGCWSAAVIGVRITGHAKIYLRFSTLQYPAAWKSPVAGKGKTELKMQFALDL